MPTSVCELAQLNHQTIACPDCGVLHQYQPLIPRTQAICQRCGKILYHFRLDWLRKSAALWFTATLLFGITNSFPLFSMNTQGMLQELTLIKALSAFWQSDLYLISALLTFNLLILPSCELLIILWVLVTLMYKTHATPAAYLMRWLQTFKPWGMLEIFMLGALVALVKLGDLATLVLGLAFWSFSIQIVVMAILHSVFEPFWVWRALGDLQVQQHVKG